MIKIILILILVILLATIIVCGFKMEAKYRPNIKGGDSTTKSGEEYMIYPTPIHDRPYILDNNNRKYFIHENEIVYDKDGNKDEWYRMQEQGQDLFLFNSEMVMNPYEIHDKNIYINGEFMKLDDDHSKYLQMWLKCRDKPIEYDIPEVSVNWDSIASRNEKYKLPKRNPDIDGALRKLTDNFPRSKWSSKIKPNPPNTHWGQVKLTLAEIRFLNSIRGDEPKIVVYAGAAAGYHIPLLSKMFPDILFILYDPAKFGINPTSNIIIRQEMFTDEIAKLYHNMDVIFISDVRTDEDDPKTFEENVHKNNIMVEKWINIMNPKCSSLKFRFPYPVSDSLQDTNYEFLDGEIYFQQFAPSVSTETRLIINQENNYSKKVYDTKDYEEKMFYFNTKYRNRSFLDKDPVFGINYDTYMLYEIIREYIHVNTKCDTPPTYEQIAGICLEIQESIKKLFVEDLKDKFKPYILGRYKRKKLLPWL